MVVDAEFDGPETKAIDARIDARLPGRVRRVGEGRVNLISEAADKRKAERQVEVKSRQDRVAETGNASRQPKSPSLGKLALRDIRKQREMSVRRDLIAEIQASRAVPFSASLPGPGRASRALGVGVEGVLSRSALGSGIVRFLSSPAGVAAIGAVATVAVLKKLTSNEVDRVRARKVQDGIDTIRFSDTFGGEFFGGAALLGEQVSVTSEFISSLISQFIGGRDLDDSLDAARIEAGRARTLLQDPDLIEKVQDVRVSFEKQFGRNRKNNALVGG